MIPILAAVAMPIVKELMGKGLTALAGAVANKGKEYVEEKLGVKLEPGITDEKALELRQLEFDHEEALQQMAIEGRKLDLEELRAGLADIGSARKREVEIATSEHAPLLNKIIAPVLAIIVVVGGGFLLALGAADVRTAAAGLIASVLGYYFGTSIGSREKQQTIERLTK